MGTLDGAVQLLPQQHQDEVAFRNCCLLKEVGMEWQLACLMHWGLNIAQRTVGTPSDLEQVAHATCISVFSSASYLAGCCGDPSGQLPDTRFRIRIPSQVAINWCYQGGDLGRSWEQLKDPAIQADDTLSRSPRNRIATGLSTGLLLTLPPPVPASPTL